MRGSKNAPRVRGCDLRAPPSNKPPRAPRRRRTGTRWRPPWPISRTHHRLVFVDQLQGALAGLRLVRRVGGVEFAARGDGPHGRRDVVLVGAGADEIQRPAVEQRRAPCSSRPTSISDSADGTAREHAGLERGREFRRTRSSIDFAPITSSMRAMSRRVCGMNGIERSYSARPRGIARTRPPSTVSGPPPAGSTSTRINQPSPYGS